MGVTYEKLEHTIKKAVPKTFQPAVNAMFGELAALGFISTATFLLTHGGNSLFQQMLDGAAAFLGTSFHHMLHRYANSIGLFCHTSRSLLTRAHATATR